MKTAFPAKKNENKCHTSYIIKIPFNVYLLYRVSQARRSSPWVKLCLWIISSAPMPELQWLSLYVSRSATPTYYIIIHNATPTYYPSATPTYYIIISNASVCSLVLFILLLIYFTMLSAHFVDSCLKGLNLVHFCCFVLFCFQLLDHRWICRQSKKCLVLDLSNKK